MKALKAILSVISFSLLLTGCSTISGWFEGKKVSFSNFADPTKPFMGYMTVNNWSSKNPSDVLEKLVKNNVQCAPFEFFESPLAYADPNVESRLNKFEKWIKEAKERKIILYVTLYNCNLGASKTGHPEITGPGCDKQIMAAAGRFAEWMKKYPFIYLTPCGEGGTQSKFASYDRKVQNWCKANMPLSQLVNNWGARPSGTDGMAFFCQHPAGCSASMTRGAWIMSDHGTFIAKLKDYNSVYSCAVSLRARGFPFIVYDFPSNASIKDDFLKALGDAQK